MTVMQKGIIALLKSAVAQETVEIPEGFDLAEAYPLVKKHHMTTLIYDGAVRCGIDRKSEVMTKLFRDYLQVLRISEGQMMQVRRIFAAFEENDIDYMPLKGCKMKAYYPKPELRIMGDADILIRMEQYERIKPIMCSLGFEAKKETDHELVWQNEGLYLELHKRVIPNDNIDLYTGDRDGWEYAKQQEGNRYSMTAEDEFRYMFSHFTKHYRNGGIGCRHMVDLWVYLRSHPEIRESEVRKELKRVRLLEFYDNIRHTIAVWFEDASATEKTDFITEFVFNSGSWGTDESKNMSRAVRFSQYAQDRNRGKWNYIRQTLFPGKEMLHPRYRYRFLEKAPFLLPLVWVIRFFDKLFVERDAVNRQRRSLKMFRQEHIDATRQAMNYVGLDYHFE